jgi:NADP-dependent 3-hydroxy acid dehydrogenase YdfG
VARAILYVGDQQPSLPTTVKDSAGNVVNLTGYTGVTFALRQAYDTANKFKAAGVIVTAAAGTIRYDLGANDLTTGIVPGVYEGQWTLLDASSKPQHVDAGQFEIRKGF